jgi:O-antigen/teichoic acid export membrane protein
MFFNKWKLESFKTTIYFRGTLSKYSIILLTSIASNVLIYLDRLIIFPILGPEYVSIYSVASFFGKSLSIVAGPISGVLLGYFASKSFIMNLKKYNMISLIMFLMTVIFIPLIFLIAPFVTRLLYPSIYVEALPYLFLANIGAVLAVLSRMLQPAVLKYAPTYWQIVKETIFGIVYVSLSIVLMLKYQLVGLIYAAIISNVLKCILLYILGYVYIKKIISSDINDITVSPNGG